MADKVKRPVEPEIHSMREFGDKLDRLDLVSLSILANPRIDLKATLPWQSIYDDMNFRCLVKGAPKIDPRDLHQEAGRLD